MLPYRLTPVRCAAFAVRTAVRLVREHDTASAPLAVRGPIDWSRFGATAAACYSLDVRTWNVARRILARSRGVMA